MDISLALNAALKDDRVGKSLTVHGSSFQSVIDKGTVILRAAGSRGSAQVLEEGRKVVAVVVFITCIA